MIDKMTIKKQSEINAKREVNWGYVVHKCPICGGVETKLISFFQERHKVCRDSKRGQKIFWTDESSYAKYINGRVWKRGFVGGEEK